MDRTYLRASLLGAAAALVVFLGLLTYGGRSLLAHDTLGGFYEAQARALFDGHLDVDPGPVSFEGFVIDGRTYIYQGPVPALLRMPVMAVTDRFDGRMTRLSMLAAYLLALGAVIRLGWTLRRFLRGDGPVGRFEAVLAGLTTFGAGASTLLFLGSKPWVYHEAILWGAALALASFAALARWRCEPDRGWRGLAWAAGFAGAALLSRPSVGLGPVAALGLVGLQELVALRSPSARTPRAWARVAGLLLGALLPLSAYAAINQAKFGSPYRLPIEKQVLVSFDQDRQAALEANDGSLFGLGYAPSVAWQAIRPDGVAPRRVFPFVGFPAYRPTVIGDAVFAERDHSSSLPASEPLLVALAAIGLVALLRRPRGASSALGMVVLGAATGAIGTLVLGYMANRYLSDAIPAVVLLALLGLPVVAGWALRRSRRVRLGVAAVVALLALWGAWVNTSLGLQYQREVAPGAPEGSRIDWLDLQARLGPTPRWTAVGPDEPLPPPGRIGRIAVVGDCDGVYRSTGGDWQPVETGPATGRLDLELRPRGTIDGPVPIAVIEAWPGRAVLELQPAGGDEVRPVVRLQLLDGSKRVYRGDGTLPLGLGTAREVRVTLDWRLGYAEVIDREDGDVLLGATVDPLPEGPPRPLQGGRVVATPLPPDRRACKALGIG